MNDTVNRYGFLAESMRDAFVSVTMTGQITQFNEMYRAMLGYDREELATKTYVDLTPDEWHEFEANLVTSQVLPTGHSEIYEKEYRRKDGTVFPVELRTTLLRDADGRPQEMWAIIRDITERKCREGELLQARRAAEEANRAKSAFLAAMSHELRTPLNAILGFSEILRDGILGDLNVQQRQGVTNIEENGRHLLTLITDLLDFSRIEAGRMDLDLTPVDLDELCQASLNLVRDAALKKQLAVSHPRHQSPPTMLTDPRRLQQILVKLLDNAVKFTPDGGGIGLEVTSDAKRQEVRFTVWDTGIGIAPDDLEQLFKPFVQLDSRLARQHEGTGLGLILVARLTELLGGAVTVASEPGVGSRIVVTLPLKANPEPGEV